VVVAYGRILPRSVFELPQLGAVNVHFSLLPRYRGAAPVQWCLARGETTTGVTTMRISEGLDEGDILLQKPLEVAPGEHAPSLGARLAGAGVPLLLRTLDGLESGTIGPTRQDPSLATFAPALRKEDGCPPLTLSAWEVEGRVRGFDPWPGVWFRCRGRRLRLLEAAAEEGRSEAPPGRVEALLEDRLVIAFAGGSRLAVRRLQPEGRRAVNVREAVYGRQILPGDDLEPDRGHD